MISIDTLRGAAVAAAALLLAACGDGRFAEAEYDVCDEATEPMGMTAADFNGDGAADLAVTCGPKGMSSDGGQVEVYLADGEGGLARDGAYRTGDGPGFVTAADMNGDGVLDLIVTLRGAQKRGIAQLLGKGDGTFRGPTVESLGSAGVGPVAIADIDGNGAMDILIPTMNAVLRNEGSARRPGPFQRYRLSERGDRDDGAVADVDGDGVMDAIRRLPRHGQLHVYRGHSSERVDVVVGKAVRGVLGVYGGADINGDGQMDLALEMHKSSKEREVRLAVSGDGKTWRIGPALAFLGHPRDVAFADFDQDGRPDLLRTDRADPRREEHRLTVHTGGADGSFGESKPVSLPAFANGVAIADFDGNGAPDIAVRHHGSGRISLLVNERSPAEG